MLVVEKTRRISVEVTGEGVATVQSIIQRALPGAVFTFEPGDLVPWRQTAHAKEITASKTPGKLLRAYRERAGLTVVDVARKVSTQYPNISAMENDRRTIGLRMARKLGAALGVEYTKLLT